MKRLTPYVFCVSVITAFALTVPADNTVSAAVRGTSPAVGCKVTRNGGSNGSIVATGQSVHLAKGTILTPQPGSMHQGYKAFKARVGGKLQKVAVQIDDTNCS